MSVFGEFLKFEPWAHFLLDVRHAVHGIRVLHAHVDFQKGDFVSGLNGNFPFFIPLAVFSALDAPLNQNLCAHVQRSGITGISSPGDAGNIVGFIVHAVYGQHEIADFPAQRGNTNHGRFAEVSFQENVIFILLFCFRRKKFLGEDQDVQLVAPFRKFVISPNLPLYAYPLAGGGEFIADQVIRDENSDLILVSAAPLNS